MNGLRLHKQGGRFAIVAALACVCSPVLAQEASLAQQAQAHAKTEAAAAASLVAKTQAVQSAYSLSHTTSLHETVAAANKAKLTYLRQLYKEQGYRAPSGPAIAKGTQILVFASKSMPDGDVRGLLEDAYRTPGMRVVFLGGEPHTGVPGLVNWLRRVGAGLKHLPAIEIDPPAFAKYHVRWVPDAVVVRDGKEIARVAGVYQPQWIMDHVGTKGGNLGTYGTLYRPVELNMEAVIKGRIAAFNWKAYVDGAVHDFWRDQVLPLVPHAKRPKTYLIDPTITITHNITLPNGTILARAGERVNPLQHMVFMLHMLVIDASSAPQRTFAKNYIARHPDAQIVVMSTAVPSTSNHGWRTWAQWSTAVGHRLTLYSEAYAQRFKIQGTPSIIDGDGAYLKVMQYAMNKKGEWHAAAS